MLLLPSSRDKLLLPSYQSMWSHFTSLCLECPEYGQKVYQDYAWMYKMEIIFNFEITRTPPIEVPKDRCVRFIMQLLMNIQMIYRHCLRWQRLSFASIRKLQASKENHYICVCVLISSSVWNVLWAKVSGIFFYDLFCLWQSILSFVI